MTNTSNPVGDPRVVGESGDKQPFQPRPDDQFDRFKALTGKLVNVPKDEIDEKRRKA